jgi:four helix bundle protein
MSDSPVKDKSYKFAIRIVKAYKHLADVKREFVLSRQMLRSGTAIGANVRKANQAESRNEFIHKMCVALEEASETDYWLELLHETQFLEQKEFDSLHADCEELLKLLTSIVKSSKQQK